jgi:hypothetical protein
MKLIAIAFPSAFIFRKYLPTSLEDEPRAILFYPSYYVFYIPEQLDC